VGEKSITVIVFGEERDYDGLRVHAFEGLGLEVNSLTNQLEKSEALLAVWQ